MFNYYRDEPNSGLGGTNNDINYSIKDSKSLDYKSSIIKKLGIIDEEKNVEIAMPLKYLSNVWRNLDMPLITVKCL